MKNSLVLVLAIVGCVVANNYANALPRGSEVNKPKAYFPDDTEYGDTDANDEALQRVSCDAIAQQIMQFIQNLFGRLDGSYSASNNPDDLTRDVFQGYDVLLNPNTRMSPLKFFKFVAKLAKIIPKIVNVIQQIQGPQSQPPEVIPPTTTTERAEKRGIRG